MSSPAKPATNATAQIINLSQERDAPPLSFHVRQAMERYFNQLNGHAPGELYDFVLGEIERPLLEVVMRETQGNQLRASEILGINRNTLRKKLLAHGLLDSGRQA